MKLIVGLGNPGIKYANTRHNIGFMFMDKYFAKKNISESKEKFNGLIATFKHKGENVILLNPLTYMNLSGEAVSKIAKYYNIEAKDVLVIYDDLDLPFASLRLREKGNPGTHNGMKSITNLIGNDFYRIRVGIGKNENYADLADYVLSKFNAEELATLDKVFDDVCSCCDLFIDDKFNMAMNKYNRKN